jgi:hypothetical protein
MLNSSYTYCIKEEITSPGTEFYGELRECARY